MILNLTERELHVIISALIYEKADRRKELDAWKPDMTKEPILLIEERCRMIERYNEIDNLKKLIENAIEDAPAVPPRNERGGVWRHIGKNLCVS